jgi:hypothetical protein
MDNITYLSRAIATADRNRRRMQKEGVTPNGCRIWTDAELQKLKELYPDYRAAAQILGRSYFAIRNKSQEVGLAPKRHRWTAAEVSRLRGLYPCGTSAELLAAFPAGGAPRPEVGPCARRVTTRELNALTFWS